MQQYERRSDVDGFQVIWRRKRSPKVHLLRSWDECNVELARKRGVKVTGVAGSRESLLAILEGWNTVAWCLRCFPEPKVMPEPVMVEEFADAVEGI